LHDFRGKLAHSAAWDETIDTSGKKVAVIGTGSSSIQMVPSLAKGQLCVIVILRKTKSKPTGAEHLTIFMRNQVWISPQIPTDAQKLETSDRKAIIGRHYYTEEEKQSFRNDSYFHLAYRKELRGQNGQEISSLLARNSGQPGSEEDFPSGYDAQTRSRS
jgi:cation diffusion facilitator CzcD-associated flavoprotein CzcO